MGRIAKLLSFVRAVRHEAKVSDVKIDPGGGENITAEHFQPAGDDSFPLTTDYVVTVEVPGGGREAVVGFVDPVNNPSALEGEKRIYARDKDTGAIVVSWWLKNDGSAVLANASGTMTLQPDGTFNINGATIAPDGSIDSPVAISAPSVVADSKELAGHDHPAGTPPGDTGPNN